MSELELLFQKILDRYPAQSNLELKILGVKERPEYKDKVIRRRYVLTVDMDAVVDAETECPICKGYGKLYDPVHTWAHVQCHACEGTGIEKEWHKKLQSSVTNSEEDVCEHS